MMPYCTIKISKPEINKNLKEAGTVKLCWCITGPVALLGSNIELVWCQTVANDHLDLSCGLCIHPCHLLRARHYCLWHNSKEGPPLA